MDTITVVVDIAKAVFLQAGHVAVSYQKAA